MLAHIAGKRESAGKSSEIYVFSKSQKLLEREREREREGERERERERETQQIVLKFGLKSKLVAEEISTKALLWA